jgi:WD40 repeat protein
LPGNEVFATAWSPDGQYLSVGSNITTANRFTIYKRSGDTFTKLTDPATMPGINVYTTAWSPDGQYLSVGSGTTTADRFTIYKRSGDTFTKLTDPATMPGNEVFATAWSPDGQYLSVGSQTTTADRFTIYKFDFEGLPIQFHDNAAITNGAAIAASVDDPDPGGTGSAVLQSYVESNPFTNPNAIPAGRLRHLGLLPGRQRRPGGNWLLFPHSLSTLATHSNLHRDTRTPDRSTYLHPKRLPVVRERCSRGG